VFAELTTLLRTGIVVFVLGNVEAVFIGVYAEL